MKNNDTRAMQNPNGEDCTYNRPCSPHGSECASCEYAQSVTHNIAMSAERAHELAHDAEHLRKLMVFWPQNHMIHQLAAALLQTLESSKQTELREITKVRLEVIGYGSVPASLEEQRVMARTLLSGSVKPVMPEQCGLIELLNAIKPTYGAVGSRDVDVTTQRKRIDDAIAMLAAQPVSGHKPVGYFSYGSEHGFDWHKTKKDAIEAAEAAIDDYRGDACDGWSEETDSVCWGVILQQAARVDERPRTDDDKCDPAIDMVCDYALLPEKESE